MEFSRQEYWSGLPFSSPGDLPEPGTEHGFLTLHAGSLPSEPLGKPIYKYICMHIYVFPYTHIHIVDMSNDIRDLTLKKKGQEEKDRLTST